MAAPGDPARPGTRLRRGSRWEELTRQATRGLTVPPTTDTRMIRLTLAALDVSSDDWCLGLLRSQLEGLRQGCGHERQSLLSPGVLVLVPGREVRADLFECVDCLTGLVREAAA